MNALLLAVQLYAATIAPGDTVRVSASGNGTRYHLWTCPAVAHGSRLVWRVSADSLGYVPCRRCFAPKRARLVPRSVEAR